MKSTIFATLAFISPLVSAHGAIYGDYAFGSANGGISSNPLTKSLSLHDWFFRGLTPASAKGKIDLTPGGKVTLNVACSQDNADQGRMCGDFGAMHLKSNGQGSGCALLISYKNFNSIKPEDMSVFSVSHDCTKADSHRTFDVPSNLPAGEATCAFHWVPPPESSQDEQYMTGFRCNIKGNNKGSLNAASNHKPLYWAANGVQLPGNRPQYDDMPNGAQKLVVSGGSTSVSPSKGSGSKPSTGKGGKGKGNGGVTAKPVKKPSKGKGGKKDDSCPANHGKKPTKGKGKGKGKGKKGGRVLKGKGGKKCSANKQRLRMLRRQLVDELEALDQYSRL